MRIFKYDISSFELKLPKGAKLLKIDSQGSNFFLWALIDPEEEKFNRVVVMVATGQEIQNNILDNYDYISTVQDGPLVWHFFISKE